MIHQILKYTISLSIWITVYRSAEYVFIIRLRYFTGGLYKGIRSRPFHTYNLIDGQEKQYNLEILKAKQIQYSSKTVMNICENVDPIK